MKKISLICCMLLLLVSCKNNSEPTVFTVDSIQNENEYYSRYYILYGNNNELPISITIVDTIGKFDVGDTIYLNRK